MKLKYIVKSNDAGLSLKQILQRRLYVSKAQLLKLKNSRSVKVDGANQIVSYIPKIGQLIVVDFDNFKLDFDNTIIDSFRDKYKLWNKKIDIVYEDDYLLIVNKPAGIPVNPGSLNQEKTLSNMLMNYFVETNQNIFKIHIVSRLDKDTSGLCIIAKNEYVQELFARKKDLMNLKKIYIAVVNNIILDDHGIIEKNIKRKSGSIILRQVDESGDYSKTEHEVLKRDLDNNYTVLKILLHTGRTHQIRVHFASIGHVLLGDELYAIEHNQKGIRKYISRQALHCYILNFMHPITGKEINLEAKIPEDINLLLK